MRLKSSDVSLKEAEEEMETEEEETTCPWRQDLERCCHKLRRPKMPQPSDMDEAKKNFSQKPPRPPADTLISDF